MDHRFRYVETLLIVADQPAPARHPTERALDHPVSGQQPKVGDVVRPVDDLHCEVAVGSSVEQLGAVVGRVAKQMLEPRPTPATADAIS